jgi:predicted restriction endonuclease
MLMEFLKIQTNKYATLSVGRKFTHSNSDIIQKFRSFGITNNARVLSDFVYSPLFKKQWKNIIIEKGKENPDDNLEFALQKLNEEMKNVKPKKRKALVEQTLRNDYKIVGLLKQATNYKCQFPNCIAEIRTRSGTNYVEVAHIEPVHKGGQSILGNLIVLCPNHHKEFDKGFLHIDVQSDSILTGTLNGKTFKINQKRN